MFVSPVEKHDCARVRHTVVQRAEPLPLLNLAQVEYRGGAAVVNFNPLVRGPYSNERVEMTRVGLTAMHHNTLQCVREVRATLPSLSSGRVWVHIQDHGKGELVSESHVARGPRDKTLKVQDQGVGKAFYPCSSPY